MNLALWRCPEKEVGQVNGWKEVCITNPSCYNYGNNI